MKSAEVDPTNQHKIMEPLNDSEQPYHYLEERCRLISENSADMTWTRDVQTGKFSEIFFRAVFQHAAVSMILINSEGIIQESNQSAQNVFGYAGGELEGVDYRQLIAEEDREGLTNLFSSLIRNDLKTIPASEIRYVRKDRSTLWGRCTVSAIYDGENQFKLAMMMVEDITDQKNAEEKLAKVNLALVGLMECVKAIIHANNEKSMLEDICQIIVNISNYDMAWYGMAENDEEKTIRPMAQAGSSQEVSQISTLSWKEPGVYAIAIKTGKPIISKNGPIQDALYNDLNLQQQNEFLSSISLPIIPRLGSYGILNIYSSDPSAFTRDEVELLTEFSEDLTYGLDVLRMREAKEQAERKITQNSAFTQTTASFSDALVNVANDFRAVEDVAVRHVVRVIGNTCIIRLFSGDSKYLIQSACYHPNPIIKNSLNELLITHPLKSEELTIKDAAIDGQIVTMTNPTADELREFWKLNKQDPIEQFDIRNIVIAPLRAQGKIIGVIAALCMGFEQKFTREELLFFQNFADRIGMAISNARLFEQVQSYSATLEQRVTERTAQLETANKELEAFSYSVSHDLRAPLRAIDGFSRILIEDYSKGLDPEALHYLTLVRANTQQMGHLVDDLLSFSRLGRQALKIDEVDIESMVHQVVEDLSLDIQNRNIHIDIQELPPCQADPVLLKQVIVNLLSNAIKFSRCRDVAQITIGYIPKMVIPANNGESENQTVARIYFIKDNGVGFDMRYKHKLFTVFQRLHRAEDYEGTGVGLAIIKRIITRHGGMVWAESEENKGATFYFTL